MRRSKVEDQHRTDDGFFEEEELEPDTYEDVLYQLHLNSAILVLILRIALLSTFLQYWFSPASALEVFSCSDDRTTYDVIDLTATEQSEDKHLEHTIC